MKDIEYWQETADVLYKDAAVYFNPVKVRQMVQKILSLPINEETQIVELGCMYGYVAHCLRTIFGGLNYVGFDIVKISEEYKKDVRLDIRLGAITDIPIDQDFADCIFLFDVLEHVDPKSRDTAYKELARVLKPDGLVIVNNPLSRGAHNKQFEWLLTGSEIHELCSTLGVTIMKLETYYTQKGFFPSQFMVLK